MNAVIALAGIIASGLTVGYLIAGMLKNRVKSTTAQIDAAVRYYRYAVVFAAVAAGLELFDLGWFSLFDFVTLAVSYVNLRLTPKRLAIALETDRLEAERAAAANDLPWPL